MFLKKYFFAGFFLSFFTILIILYFCNKFDAASSRFTSSNYIKKRVEGYDKLILNNNIEEISLTSEDNIKLSGLLIYRPLSKYTLLICHGYRQAKEFLYQFADLASDCSIFLFDLRAHGLSEGKKISFGYHEYKDVKTAYDFLIKDHRTKNKPIIALGLSMGCFAILKAYSSGCKFSGLILDSCFVQLSDQIVRKLKIPSWFSGITNFFSDFIFSLYLGVSLKQIKPIDYISEVSIPILIIHSEDDKIVSVENAYKLFDKIRCQKKLWIVQQARHAFIHETSPNEYKKQINEFIKMIDQKDV